MHLRNRRAGDTFKTHEKSGTKPLKKLLNERGIPPEKRDRLCLVADAGGIVWIETVGAAWRVRCDESTKNACFIIVERKDL